MGPEREGYTFVGWYTEAVGGEAVEKQTYYASNQHLEPITDNITLYAHWQWNGEGPEPDPVPDEPVIDGGDGSGFGAVLAVAGGAAVVGAAGFGIYELATRAILKDLLPEGTAIPAASWPCCCGRTPESRNPLHCPPLRTRQIRKLQRPPSGAPNRAC